MPQFSWMEEILARFESVILERLKKLDLDIVNDRKELEGMLKTGGNHE